MRGRAALILAMLAIIAPAADATVTVPADLRELAAGARAIVHGRVVATEARWAEGRRQIETLVTIEATDYLKGDFGRDLTFKVPGGQMGHYRSLMVGAPAFREGDEVVVFLDAQGPAVPWIVGFNQGVYRVAANAAGAKMIVAGVSLARGEEAERVVRGDPSRAPQSLSAFTAQVRTLVQQERSR
jgi:hypothetical protein